MTQERYTCAICKKTKKRPAGKQAPKCCGKPMVKLPLDICLQPDHPEHARPMEMDDACDDFRSG
ncbi:MAG: hypothetical protein QXX20_02320 [Candidatus Thermoplasmatota archaeon]